VVCESIQALADHAQADPTERLGIMVKRQSDGRAKGTGVESAAVSGAAYLRSFGIPPEEASALIVGTNKDTGKLETKCYDYSAAGLAAIANDWLEAHGRPLIIPDPRPHVPSPPRLTTPAELRAECQQLREAWLAADTGDKADCFDRSALCELWRAMRLMPDCSIPPPMPDVATIRDALASVDRVVGWRDRNGAKTASPATAETPAAAIPQDLIGKGKAPRDAKFLEWYDAAGTDTYHKPAKIHLKWDRMTTTQRATICPDRPNKIAQSTIASFIRDALKERAGKTPAKSRQRPRTKT
jgi:hypothetical protein